MSIGEVKRRSDLVYSDLHDSTATGKKKKSFSSVMAVGVAGGMVLTTSAA